MWNVNVGHGVKEIADAVYNQITKMHSTSQMADGMKRESKSLEDILLIVFQSFHLAEITVFKMV